MAEKKKRDEMSAEEPETWRSFTMVGAMAGERQASGADDEQSDLRDRITRRAYELYEERGRSDGEAMNDWLRAEAEIRSLLGQAAQGKLEKARKRPSPAPRAGARQ